MRRKVQANGWRAEIASDDSVTYYREVIAKGGMRLTWKRAGIGRYDRERGFYGGLPYGVSIGTLATLESEARKATDATIGGRA